MDSLQTGGPREVMHKVREYHTAEGVICLVKRRTPYGITRGFEVWRGNPATQKWIFTTEQDAAAFMARRWNLKL